MVELLKDKTLAGSECPREVDVVYTYCNNCKQQTLHINLVKVNEFCKCDAPDIEARPAFKIDTCKVVDAILVKFDQEPDDKKNES